MSGYADQSPSVASGATLLLLEDEDDGSEEDANGAALLDMYNDDVVDVDMIETVDAGWCGNFPKWTDEIDESILDEYVDHSSVDDPAKDSVDGSDESTSSSDDKEAVRKRRPPVLR